MYRKLLFGSLWCVWFQYSPNCKLGQWLWYALLALRFATLRIIRSDLLWKSWGQHDRPEKYLGQSSTVQWAQKIRFPTNISSQNPTTEKKTQEMRICCHTWVNRQPTLKSRRFKFWGSRQSRGTAAPTLTFQRISVEIGCWLSHQRKYHHTYHQDGSFNGEKWWWTLINHQA